MPRNRLILEWLLVFSLAVFGSLGALYSAFGSQAENILFDESAGWLAQEPKSDILLVTVDEASLSRVGQWPWPRATHAQLIDKISAARPKAIGYDVLFTEPSSPTEDEALMQSLAAAKNVILPAYFDVPGSNGQPYNLARPIASLEQSAAAIGHVNVIFEADGIVRRVQLRPMMPQAEVPHMTEALYRHLRPGPSPASRNQPALGALIPYHRAGSFSRISASAILAGEVPADFLRDRIILVGATAPGLGDTLSVPGAVGSVMAGMEVQANVIEGLLANKMIIEASLGVRAAAISVAMLGLFVFFMFNSPTANLVATLALGLLAIVASLLAKLWLNYWFAPLSLLIGLLIAYPLWSWRRLAALNRFVEAETGDLAAMLPENDRAEIRTRGLDTVARAALRLKVVIGELKGVKSFMTDVIEDAPDALSVIDPQGHVVLANSEAKAIFGDDCEGKPLKALLSLSAPGAALTDEELRLRSGKIMLQKSVPIQTNGEGEAGTIHRMADVTARRMAEREREEMLEFLSHDMRSPQSAIISLIDQEAEKGAANSPMGRIRRHAETTLKLADDFVQLARLDHAEPDIEVVDLAAIANEAIDRLYAAASAKKVTLVRPDVEDALIEADGWMLLRAITNLVDNGVKYSPAGGMLSCAIVTLEGAEGHEAEHQLRIVDEGPGLSEERRAALFERFGAHDKSASLGVGLGLAFVKKAMDLNGGQIDCQSSADGTAMILTFPAVASERD